MSDTKNHKLAIKAIIEAHRTPGKMREIMLTILADKPSAIVNAWEEVKPGGAGGSRQCDLAEKVHECRLGVLDLGLGRILKQYESP